MAGQFDRSANNTTYYLLTPYSASYVLCVYNTGDTGYRYPTDIYDGVRPSLNLKSSVTITAGDGTKNNPFIIYLAS